MDALTSCAEMQQAEFDYTTIQQSRVKVWQSRLEQMCEFHQRTVETRLSVVSRFVGTARLMRVLGKWVHQL